MSKYGKKVLEENRSFGPCAPNIKQIYYKYKDWIVFILGAFMRCVKICLISLLAVFGVTSARAQEKQVIKIVTKGTSAVEKQAIQSVITKTDGLKNITVFPKGQIPTAGTLKDNISNTPSSLTASIQGKIAQEQANLRTLTSADKGGGKLPPTRDILEGAEWLEDMFPSVPDRMFTLRQMLDVMEPDWEQLLTKHLSAEEIDAVKQAIFETDKAFFAIENEKVSFINKDSWDYRGIFAKKLLDVCNQRGIVLNNKQTKFLLGGKGANTYHAFLHDYLKLVTL